MAYNVGLNVVEVDGATAPAIVGAATSVGAFNIVTRRGVVNSPRRITSLSQFTEQFGPLFNGAIGPYLVKGFFDNGGKTAYVNRVDATGALCAFLTLQDSGSTSHATLTLKAGYLGNIDKGSWGKDLFVKIARPLPAAVHFSETARATIEGSILTEPVDMSSLPSLSVQVDGETTPVMIPFAASDFSDASKAALTEIRDTINKKTPTLIASISTDKRIVLTSTGAIASINKSWTSLRISTDNNSLGFTAASTSSKGTAATPTTSGVKLASTETIKVGDAVLISDGTNKAYVKVLSINSATGQVTWTPALPSIVSFDKYVTTIEAVTFDLVICTGNTDEDSIVEQWSGLSMEKDVSNYAVTMLNDPVRGSKYLKAVDEMSSNPIGVNVPKALDYVSLSDGADGTPTAMDFVGNGAMHTGFSSFDSFDVQMVCCERSDAAIVKAGIDYCATRSDCMYIGSVPEALSVSGAIAFGQAFQGKKVYGAIYYPYIKIMDPIGTGSNPFKWIPPTGHIMGVYSRIETNRGIWKAPAGDEASIYGALDVETRISDADLTELVKSGAVNGVRVVPRSGIIVETSRTLSTDTRWLYVNVRLLFNYVKSSLKLGLSWVRQEPNRDTLWNAVKFSTVRPFLMGLWRQGAFGTGNPDDVFSIICDASNNPPDQVDQGNFKLEVYFYPSKPAETIVIMVGQKQSGAKASES